MGILKGIIDRFRAMGKTEKEISGIIETAADKATANPDVTKPEKQREPEIKIETTAKGKKDIRITAAGQGNSFEDIECQLIGEKGKGWRELIAAAIDKAYENMIANTPPTTEEERTHCEMIKEAVKGMFINESRTAAEAEFIKTHIVDYEKIFDVCMNGDDLEFKKGLVRLQKMQNEYVMQREND